MNTKWRRRRRGHASSGVAGTEYVAMVGVIALIAAAIVTVSVPEQEMRGLQSAVCRVLHPVAGDTACATDDEAGDGGDGGDGGGGGGGDGDEPVDPANDPFQPAKCLLSEDQTKDTVVIQILFIKISHSESVKISQWSDGTVTLERVTSTSGGVTMSISAGIPGLKDWGGSASLGGSYMRGSGSGGVWMFNGNKSDNAQADLEANLADAKKFTEYLKAQDKCNSRPAGPRASEMGLICGYWANKEKPDIPPEEAPDIDITKTSTDISGSVSFGKTFGKNIGSKDAKAMGSGSLEGLNGSMAKEITVLRTKTGPDAGKVTFVYTFEMKGTAGAGGQATGTKMQQVAVTYDAAAYDQEDKDGAPHHPEKLKIVTSEEAGEGAGISLGAGANAGPVTIDIGGGGGEMESTLHTEIAEAVLGSDEESKLVEDWLRGNGDFPAEGQLPSPSSAAEPLGDDATAIDRLLHDKAQLQRLDYKVNTDWWNASLGIGFGVSAGQFELGFKLFGIDITHEHREQTITGNPTYASGPRSGGARPWVEFTNCTKTTPIPA
ncbi:hypothetical protein [Streptomyces sp. NPDC051569]|uniref:hypothetical protein n=1 Tax=Streptomyces sp. NPDC051569 TaxID=3365661 RepID=UPI00379442D2